MATRIIQGTLASSSGNSIFLQPTSGELSGTITSYGAPITSGTISSVNFSFNNSPITIYTTDTFVEVKLDNDVAGTMIFDSTGSYTNAELLGYNPDLLFLSPVNVTLRATSGLAAAQGSYTFTITITYNESTTTPTLTAPTNLKLSASSGEEVTLTWTEAQLNNSEINYTITYKIGYLITGQDVVQWPSGFSTYNNSFLINKQWFLDNNIPNDTEIQFWLEASVAAYDLFKYVGFPEFKVTLSENEKNQNLVGYYTNGAWQECTVYYYDGSEWVECIPYYYDNGWQEINTKIE